LASEDSDPGGSPQVNDAWKAQNRTGTPKVTQLSNGRTATTTEYQGQSGNRQVKLLETVVTDANGDVVSRVTRSEVVDLNTGLKTVAEVAWDKGSKLYEHEATYDRNGDLYVERKCDPDCRDPTFGPAHPTNQQKVKELTDIIDDALKWVGYGVDSKEAAEIIRKVIKRLTGIRCARFTGNDTAKLFYKDDRGVELDIAGMVHQCSCKSRVLDCPLCAPLGIGPATSCESAEEKTRRECLMNPFGPTDEVRPECIAALEKDNSIVNIDAKLCSAVRCSNNRAAKFTISADLKLSCGCFAQMSEFAPGTNATAVCQIMRCDTGTCKCQTEGGLRTCGCVASVPPVSPPSAPPFDLGIPRPPAPPR
jgi:hypothetical protein